MSGNGCLSAGWQQRWRGARKGVMQRSCVLCTSSMIVIDILIYSVIIHVHTHVQQVIIKHAWDLVQLRADRVNLK